jgi:hypothetical protein
MTNKHNEQHITIFNSNQEKKTEITRNGTERYVVRADTLIYFKKPLNFSENGEEQLPP